MVLFVLLLLLVFIMGQHGLEGGAQVHSPSKAWRTQDFQARFIVFSTLQNTYEIAWCKSLRPLPYAL